LSRKAPGTNVEILEWRFLGRQQEAQVGCSSKNEGSPSRKAWPRGLFLRNPNPPERTLSLLLSLIGKHELGSAEVELDIGSIGKRRRERERMSDTLGEKIGTNGCSGIECGNE